MEKSVSSLFDGLDELPPMHIGSLPLCPVGEVHEPPVLMSLHVLLNRVGRIRNRMLWLLLSPEMAPRKVVVSEGCGTSQAAPCPQFRFKLLYST